MNPQTRRKLHPACLRQAGIELSQSLHDAQPGAHGALGVIFVRLGIAKVDQQAITEILRNMPLKAGDDLGTSLLIGPHNLPQVFRVQLRGESRGIHQITKQHGELAAFGLRRRCSRGGCRWHQGDSLGGALRRARPHQHRAVLVHRQLFHLNQFHLEVGQILVIEGKLALEGAIGGATLALQELDDAGEHGIEVHHCASTCASTASTCGSQNVMSIA
jgi:hypothetical protein